MEKNPENAGRGWWRQQRLHFCIIEPGWRCLPVAIRRHWHFSTGLLSDKLVLAPSKQAKLSVFWINTETTGYLVQPLMEGGAMDVKIRLPRKALGWRFCRRPLLVAWLQPKDPLFISVENTAVLVGSSPSTAAALAPEKAFAVQCQVSQVSGKQDAGGGCCHLGLKWPKAEKTGSTWLSLKLLWFCGVNILFNVVAIFSCTVRTLRSSHMRSLTTNRYFSSNTTCYTNTAHTKSIVRECNPVTGFRIKERINRNTKTTL